MAASKRNPGKKNQGSLDREDTENLSGETLPDEEKDAEEEDEEVGEDYETPLEDDDFISDEDDSDELALADETLTPKEQDARSLAIRRSIEQRMEQKKLDEDLDYLDLDS